MKKTIVFLMAMAGSVAAQAYDYPYLTIQTVDGTEQSVAVASLKLTFSDGKLVVTNSDGTQTFTLSSLSKMFFSASQTAGISDATTTTDADGSAEVYSVGGMFLGQFESIAKAKESLKPGIYVVKTKTKTLKISIK